MPVHPPNVLSRSLPPEAHLGPIDPTTLPAEIFEATEEEARIALERRRLPGPSVALNLYDFVVRRPGQPADKYGLRAYDEIILAPMVGNMHGVYLRPTIF